MPRPEGRFARLAGAGEKSGQRKPGALTAGLEFSAQLSTRANNLEVQFQAELELSRIKRRSRPAVVPTVAGSQPKSVHDLVERVGRSFIETIEQIESFGDDVQERGVLVRARRWFRLRAKQSIWRWRFDPTRSRLALHGNDDSEHGPHGHQYQAKLLVPHGV